MRNIDTDLNELLALVKDETDKMKTIVVRDDDDGTRWYDRNEDNDFEISMLLARTIMAIGIIALDNWEAIDEFCPEELKQDVVRCVEYLDDESESETEE